jgi:hypothetical protein
MFNKFSKAHRGQAVTDVLSSSKAYIAIYELELYLKGADTAICLVTLVNPSFERDFT